MTAQPIHTQKQRAKQLAMEYYRKVLAIDGANQDAATLLNEIENETVKAWSFCGD